MSVESSVRRDNLVDESSHGLRITHVAGAELGSAAVGGREVVDRRTPTGDDGVTGGEEGATDPRPDALGPTGDHDHASAVGRAGLLACHTPLLSRTCVRTRRSDALVRDTSVGYGRNRI